VGPVKRDPFAVLLGLALSGWKRREALGSGPDAVSAAVVGDTCPDFVLGEPGAAWSTLSGRCCHCLGMSVSQRVLSTY